MTVSSGLVMLVITEDCRHRVEGGKDGRVLGTPSLSWDKNSCVVEAVELFSSSQLIIKVFKLYLVSFPCPLLAWPV